jgi:hypothetical protein
MLTYTSNAFIFSNKNNPPNRLVGKNSIAFKKKSKLKLWVLITKYQLAPLKVDKNQTSEVVK